MFTASPSLLALIGTSTCPAGSPEHIQRAFAQAGIEVATFPVEVDAAGLGAFVELARGMRNLRGFLVTAAFEATAAGMVDERSPPAAAAGAVNLVRRDPDGRLAGDRIDGLGSEVSRAQADGIGRFLGMLDAARPAQPPTLRDHLSEPTPAARLLGREILAVDAQAGSASLRFHAPGTFGNRHGTVHGGMIAAMLDSATSCAVLAGLPPERTSLTMRLETRYLKPAALGMLSASAQVVERDERRALVEAQLFDGAGVHVASAVGEFRLRDRRV